jgi:hypothetical protein
MYCNNIRLEKIERKTVILLIFAKLNIVGRIQTVWKYKFANYKQMCANLPVTPATIIQTRHIWRRIQGPSHIGLHTSFPTDS